MEKERTRKHLMKDSKIINGLALLGVLIVILGVTSAANQALAGAAGTGLNLAATASIQN